MAKNYDISTMELEEIEAVVDQWEPFDPAEPPSFEPTRLSPNPDVLTEQEILKNLPVTENPDTMSDEEMFSSGEISYRLLGIELPSGATETAKKAIEKGTDYAWKGIWKGLGVLSWPFERIEYGIGTPLTQLVRTAGPLNRIEKGFIEEKALSTPLAKSIYKNRVRDSLTPYAKKVLGENLEPMLDEQVNRLANGWLTHEEIISNLSEAKAQMAELLPAFYHGAKSFVPFTRNNPEKVKNFNDLWGAYYEELTGEPAPEWYKQMSGISTSFLVTPLLFGKIVKGIRIGVSRLPFVKAVLNNRLPQWKDAKLVRRANIYERNERAANIGKKLADKDAKRIAHQLSLKTGTQISKEAVKQRMGQIIKGSITEQGILKEATSPAIEELQANFKTLQKLGLLGEETYLTKLTKARIGELNAEKIKLTKQLTRLQTAPHYVGTPEISARFPGRATKIRELEGQIEKIDDILWNADHFGAAGVQYMPRMYATKEAELAAKKFPVRGGPKIKRPYAKKRGKIPEEVREQMGEIIEPAYPITKRLIQEAQDIETAKMFDFVASKGEWVDDIWRSGLYEKALPDTKAYGSLAGKFVKPQIYHDIQEITRIRGNVESLYDATIGTWKTGKVVLNPATHFRNTMSNSILLDLSGTDHAQQSKLFVKALGEIRKGSDEYKMARKFFGHTTMMQGEVMDELMRMVQADKSTGLQKGINVWNNYFGKATGVPRRIYQEEEFIFKFMKYLEQREQGMSVMRSVNEANKWLFDYGDLSHFEKTVMRRVAPFYTFPRKALPRVLEAAEKNPMTIAKYPMAAWAMEKYALHQLELTDNDYSGIQKVLPEYMQNGSYMLLPFRDQNGKLRFLDLTYIVPWGELYDAQDRGLLGTVVANPIIQVTADIARNKSGWNGREIWQETDTPKERTFKQMIHFWQSAAPSLMYKGIYWDKMYNAATGKPSKMGDIEPLAPAIAHTVFGLRTQAIDPEEQALFRQFEKMRKAEELEKKISDIVIRAANGNITEEEYNERREQYMQQIQGLFTEGGEGEGAE
jgi:hypothetical protein